jgi:hypothetical protein
MKSFLFEAHGIEEALGVNYTSDFGGRYPLVSVAIVLTEVRGLLQLFCAIFLSIMCSALLCIHRI